MAGNKNIGIDRNGRKNKKYTKIKHKNVYKTIPVLLALLMCVENYNMLLGLQATPHIFW